MGTAKVYKWWDDEQRRWRYDLTPVEGHDEVIEVTLPEHFDTYETEFGEVLAYDTRTEPRDENVYHDAWRIGLSGDWLTLVDARHERKTAIKIHKLG